MPKVREQVWEHEAADTATVATIDMNGIQKLSRDLREGAAKLSEEEARFLVDEYYIIQDSRIRACGQVRSISESGEPTHFLGYIADQFDVLEKQIRYTLDRYSKEHILGEWPRAVIGIGPVIVSGLIAHLEIKDRPTVGKWYAFGGIAPGVVWEKKQKRPWNAALKVLFWKAGESFIKHKGNPNDFYGKLYDSKKAEYQAKNESFGYRDRAAEIIASKNFNKTTDAYKHYSDGRLPPAHIHAMARRYAVKIFLSHLHEVWWFQTYGTLPPAPFPIAHLGHTDYIPVPYREAIPNIEGYSALR